MTKNDIILLIKIIVIVGYCAKMRMVGQFDER